MANGTLQSLFRDSKNRLTDRETFAQVIARLSAEKARKDDQERKPEKGAEKAA
jgi:hypothetical protein